VTDLSWVAEELGQDIATSDVQLLVGILPDPEATVATTDLALESRRLLARLRAASYRPDLILAPRQWQILEGLSLDLDGDHRGSRAVEGTVDDVPVLVSSRCPDDTIWAMDLGRFAEWLEWGTDGEVDLVPIDLQLLFFGREEAAALLREHPEVAGERRDDETIDDLQAKALFEAFPRFAPHRLDKAGALGLRVE
jgi:hypothetical protein